MVGVVTRSQKMDHDKGITVPNVSKKIEDSFIKEFVESPDEVSEDHSANESPIAFKLQEEEEITKGIAPFRERLQTCVAHRKIVPDTCNLWESMKDCKISLDLTTLVEISPL
ncbi:hypothetical protein GOP47_0030615 [Adiantum capillus-veneris]|nr:hypothetical protein GOP47_0030615 [Adiantum capillus-veneris]